MADLKISQLTVATTPLAGTEVLPIVQSSATKQIATNDLTVRNVRAAATTGILQVSGPTAASTRTMTVPDANFTAARTDAAQTFSGVQTFSGSYTFFVQDPTKSSLRVGSDGGNDIYLPGTTALNVTGLAGINLNAGVGLPRVINLGTTGNVTVDTGNVIIATSGKGIDFSATPGTGTSELLYDYEEGTYTAALTPETSGTIPLNSSFDTLAYTKVGRLVTITGQIQIFNPVSPIGAFFTLNLPFTPADLTELAGRGGFILNYQNTAVSASWVEGTAVIYINKNASTVLNLDNLYLSFSYFAA
jgi:hypothetical protein